ncbi:FAD-dependent oxidoreductase [Legionella sp. D16C41]|uniref:FAD-dependent oxidoreductase n=1 Tax=Legionella sp. D16C41 TaxID=3402688 RepID=UPI003AF6436C
MKKVIIGAGPAGLYAAIKFRKKGLLDVVVYDPRAGRYTRPGHLNTNVFARVNHGLHKDVWPADEVGHIRDLEKALYKEAKQLGITIENKRFLRLHEDAKKPGVVVIDKSGNEEIVEADYVFDCTGTRREVVNAVNKVDINSPFKLTSITEPPVRNHFLAYVKINEEDWIDFQIASKLRTDSPNAIDPLSFTRSLIKLRELGWKEFRLPRCYGMEFNKNKVCLYLHAPDNLSKENYDNWVQTVLESYFNPIHYNHLPAKNKPYFLMFPMNTQALQQVSYKGRNLPTVVALGDAQIDFDYFLAHGIRDGVKRIDALLKHMEILNNEIYYFDSEEYLQCVMTDLKDHKEALIKEATRVQESFTEALTIAKKKFQQTLQLTNDPKEQQVITAMLAEINGRESYEEARKLFATYHNQANQLRITYASLDKLVETLDAINLKLIQAQKNLPVSFSKERQITQDLLAQLAVSWKELGNHLFRQRTISQAINAYQKALAIYKLDYFAGNYTAQELPIYSNLAIAYLQMQQFREAIAIAGKALQLLENNTSQTCPKAVQEKIVFNLIKALSEQAQVSLAKQDNLAAQEYYLQAENLVNKYSHLITEATAHTAQELINKLAKQLSPRPESNLQKPESVPSPLISLSVFNKASAPATYESMLPSLSLNLQRN